MSQLFASGVKSIGASGSASVLPMNIQGWFVRINRFDLFIVQGTLKSILSQFSNSVVSDFLWHHGVQHARLTCPHQLQEPAQTHVHQVGDAIQPCQPLSSPFPTAFNLSQHPGYFQWVSYFHQVAKALEFQLQHQSFQWIFRTDLI